jgi:Domain of unknown function (DUF4105)
MIKKILSVISVFFAASMLSAFGNTLSDTSIYLLTCAQGTETYSIYGHSAIRIVNKERNQDIVYNWGVFDFNTPNFAWKFAKGRLNYMLIAESLPGFLQEYVYEKRSVYSQKLNLAPEEKEKLVSLINENLKPENINYRYDFFYDDCSTRIRNLFEQAIGNKLLYPPPETGKIPTFRNMVARYQVPYPWLQFGIDLIMGSTSDKKASFRDRMFLPIDLKNELSEAVINRSGKMIPLLQNPDILLNYTTPVVRQLYLTSPVFVFTYILIIVIILSVWLKDKKVMLLTDIIIFSVFSLLAIMMIFFNFFTDHHQMKTNLNIIWLNPLLLICLISLLLKKHGKVWFRIVFYISASFLVLHIFLPQEFEISFIILLLIIILRSLFRAGFSWNPFTDLTKL